MLSAVIIARNEVDRIGDAIRSVAFAQEVVVLDSGSEDGTVELAKSLGARVIVTDWPGFVAQKQRAWDEARGDWVLCLDADERVSPALRAEILELLPDASADGYSMPRRNLYLGVPLRGGHWWPDRRIRLARKKCGRWGGIDPHDHLEVAGTVRPLHGELLHHPYRDLAEHLRTVDRYSAIAAREALRRGQKAGVWNCYLRPVARVFGEFFWKGGWRDGALGLLLALIAGAYVGIKWARVAGILPMPEPS